MYKICKTIIKRQLLIIVVIIFVIVNVNSVKNFYQPKCDLVCQKPQPRAIRLATLMNTTKSVAPYMVIVNRCDEGSGCCKAQHHICKVAREEEAEIKIFMKSDQKKYVGMNFTFKNHIECSCQKIQEEIK